MGSIQVRPLTSRTCIKYSPIGLVISANAATYTVSCNQSIERIFILDSQLESYFGVPRRLPSRPARVLFRGPNQNFSGLTIATNRYAKSNRETMPTMRFSIFHLQFFAEPDVKSAYREEQHQHCYVNQIRHNLVAISTALVRDGN